MMLLVGVLAFAALFALAAVAIPQRRSCGGSCGSCEHACDVDPEGPGAH